MKTGIYRTSFEDILKHLFLGFSRQPEDEEMWGGFHSQQAGGEMCLLTE